ncbi:DnaJ domain-containing protein [Cephalotus follicularis]|uniref:DnaJ domain-containing protein n=1 Tax=Cephalotus follicularis TaxID=3775 RepID=A0A1Q3AWS2_CEPFO|nr:DnaJ domain-containing protein [Cephalotus follicularis]
MENFSHSRQPNKLLSSSLSKKTCNGGNNSIFATETTYHDVFRDPPKFGAPTLSPRVEDYREIFGAFHASRASSIPVLDLPPVDEDEVFFDVRSSGFDYSEVFGGGFNGLDFAVSYEELIRQSDGGDCSSSEEAWTPAETESLSGESDHYGKNRCFLNGDSYEPIDDSMEFSISYLKANQIHGVDMPKGVTHVSQRNAVPGYTSVVDKTTQKTDDRYPSLQVTDDSKVSKELSGEMTKGKHPRKIMSHPMNGSAGGVTFANGLKLQRTYDRDSSLPDVSYVIVSDVSLRTQPSQVPPPARPPPPSRQPPATNVKKEEMAGLISTCRPTASGWIAGDSSPPYFDVEVDASSSAAASAAAMKEVMEKAQARLKSAKEFMERKKEGVQSRTTLGSKNNRKDNKGKVSKIADGSSDDRTDEGLQATCGRNNSEIKFLVMEERRNVFQTTQAVPDSLEEEKLLNGAKKSAEMKRERESWSTKGSDRIDGAGEWKEATEFFELVKTDTSRMAFEPANSEKILVQNSKMQELGQKEREAALEALPQQQESDEKVQAVKVDRDLEEHGKKLDVAKQACELKENMGRSRAPKEARRRKGKQKKVKITLEVCEQEDNGKEVRIAQQPLEAEKKPIEAEKKPSEADESEELGNFVHFQQDRFEVEQHKENEQQLKEANCEGEDNEKRNREALDKTENEKRLKEAREQEEKEKRSMEVFEWEEKENKQKKGHEREDIEKRIREPFERIENEKRRKQALEREENERKSKEAVEREENEKNQREACEREENERTLKESLEQEENKKKQREAQEREENERRLKEALEQEENEKQNQAFERDEAEKRLKEACEKEGSLNRIRDACEKEESRRGLEEVVELAKHSRMLKEALGQEENEMNSKEEFKQEEFGNTTKDGSMWEETDEGLKDSCGHKEPNGLNQLREQVQEGEIDTKLNTVEGTHVHMEWGHIRVPNEADKHVDSGSPQATLSASEHEENNEKLEATEKAFAHEKNGKTQTEPEDIEKETEAVEIVDVEVDGNCEASGVVQSNLEHSKDRSRVEHVTESRRQDDSLMKASEVGIGIGRRNVEKIKTATLNSDVENQGKEFASEWGERVKNNKKAHVVLNQEENNDNIISPVETGRKLEAVQSSMLEGKGNAQKKAHQVHECQSTERKEKKINVTLASEEKEAERLSRGREMEKDRLRKIEEEREREREREKDRMSVDRATLEARDRAYAESRDRVERVALERATAEARQRAMIEARERLEKACAEAREKSFGDNGITEARLRAERAAVERATAEARERAAEKAACEARERAERSSSDIFCASSRSNGMRPSSSSSDLQDQQFPGASYSSGSRYSYSASIYTERSEVVECESAQRCKARLERHQRTAERAAKALAEKNMRDLLAQREQAERNRLAETLDADVKRWSSGKEGNLRALLSTLQYILGPDSGWQPIPLTEVITAAAVKKAYRKATLCVHPDKLQQHGASIQQKYICEKVFDLLKEAWNRFNSEER